MSEIRDGLTRDGFLGGRLQIWQPAEGYRAAIDPVLLAAFVPAKAGESVLDLGCGVGTAALCLAARVSGLQLHGLELQVLYADLARRNAGANGILLAVHGGDLRQPPRDLRRIQFDHVMMNPPYQSGCMAMPSRDLGRDLALREGEARLADWIAAGLRRLRPGGRLSLVHRAERLGAILTALERAAGGIEILPLAPRESQPATRVLVAAIKGSGASLTLQPPAIVHAAEGSSYTGAMESVLRDMAALSSRRPA